MTVAYSSPTDIAIGADYSIAVEPVTATDISSWTVVAYLSVNSGSSPIYTLNVGNSGITYDGTSGTDGIFYINLTRTQTGSLATGVYFLAAWRTDNNSNQPLMTTPISIYNSGRPYP